MANPYTYGTRSAETRVLQEKLGAHDPKFDVGIPDGIFGKLTRDAVQAAQEFYAISPADGVPRADLLLELGITAPGAPPASNPISDFFTELVIKAALSKLKGLLSMPILSGYKTYAVGIVSVLIGVCDWIGFDIPNTASPSPSAWIVLGLAAIFGRAGLAKVVEDVITRLGGGTPAP